MPIPSTRCRMRSASFRRTVGGSILLSRSPRIRRGPGRKHDDRGDHGSCQRAAADFVDADEKLRAPPRRLAPGAKGAGASAQPSRFSLMRAALPLSARR